MGVSGTMECECNYQIFVDENRKINSSECVVRLEEETLSILPKFGEPLSITFRDVLSFKASDYKVYFDLTSKEKVILSNLGYAYDDFIRIFSKLRNEVLLKDLLMNESLRKSGVEATFAFYNEAGEKEQEGQCDPRLYETGIVIIPNKGEILRIPYSEISQISDEDYTLSITTDYGEKIEFSMMGMKFDSFRDTLSEVYTERQLEVQSYLKELLPDANPLIIRKAARLMKEGKAAKRSDIESISSELWRELENKLRIFGIKKEYDFLKKMSREQKICIGMKRGLLGDLTGEYIWFLIPLYGDGAKEVGNAIAMEATSEEGTGKATYFFRIVGRDEYQKLSLEEMDKKTDDFIKKMNKCMLAINFRREPIYLPDERLEEPRYLKYRFAIQKIPSLRILRSLFIGRVIHRSPEQWQEDVMDLLKFNVCSKEDSVKWKRPS